MEACPHKLGSTNHPRLLLCILVPAVSLLAGLLLLVLVLTGTDSPLSVTGAVTSVIRLLAVAQE